MAKGRMGKGQRIIARLAALMLLLALAVVPVFSALTHGPGQIGMKDDHAAWHADHGEHWHATDHGYPDATDHDHSTTVILPAGGDLHPPPQANGWSAKVHQRSGIIRDGPRRPPRPT